MRTTDPMTLAELADRGLLELAETAVRETGTTVAEMMARRCRGNAAEAKRRFARLLQRDRGMSQTEIGRVLGLHHSTIRVFIAGPKRSPEAEITRVVLDEREDVFLIWSGDRELRFGVVNRSGERWYPSLAVARIRFDSLAKSA